MIVDEEMLVSLGACKEAVDWCSANGLCGQTRAHFLRSLKIAVDTGKIPGFYLAWSAENLFDNQNAT